VSAWQVVDLSGGAEALRVRIKQGHITVNGNSVAHLDDALCVIVNESTQADIKVSFFTAAASHGVPIVCCDRFDKPVSMMLPTSQNSRVAQRHLAQQNLKLPKAKQAWQEIVRAKLRNQATALDDAEIAPKLREMAASVKSGDSTNREAQGARLYWRAKFGETFRRDQASGDPLNGALNYGYTVVRGSTARAITAAGLWPTLGIHHHARENAWCLADDLMEPFRPAVDMIAAEAAYEFPSPESRALLVGVVNEMFGETSLRAAMHDLAERFAMFVEGSLDRLEVPLLRRTDVDHGDV
jgi:CRISPR-associated protein Cas1